MKNTQQSISALVVLLCLATALSVAAKPKKGDPEGSDRFKGVFTRVSGGNLIMSSTGVETTVTLQPKTPIIGMFRAGKPLIDKAKGVINYQLLMSPSGNRYEEYKLQENCREIKGYRRFSFITGFTPRGLEHHGVHLEVVGFPEGENKIRAHAVYFEPVKDPLPHENPKLPRLLFIGDSMSFNYNDGLRAALNGKMNAQHPRTNCAGITVISSWLGAYEKPGRQWDVIAFNGGHWNSGSTKEEYQAAFLEGLDQAQENRGQGDQDDDLPRALWLQPRRLHHRLHRGQGAPGQMALHSPRVQGRDPQAGSRADAVAKPACRRDA